MKIKKGQLKASQIRGTPIHPVLTLHPCNMTEGIEWSLDPQLLLSLGLVVNTSGVISFSPAMLPRLQEASEFCVKVRFDAFSTAASCQFRLLYFDKDEQPHEQYSNQVFAAQQELFTFRIPVKELNFSEWFTCSLLVNLMSPMDGEERTAAKERGMENPMHPLLIRGTWLEIKS